MVSDLALVRKLPESLQFRILVDRSLVEGFGCAGRANFAAAHSPATQNSSSIAILWEPLTESLGRKDVVSKPVVSIVVYEMGTGYIKSHFPQVGDANQKEETLTSDLAHSIGSTAEYSEIV